MLNNHLLLFLLLLFITACGAEQQNSKSVDRTRTIEIGNELVIGLENEADSVAQILGQPVGVVTDEEGNIYIGDKASLSIKVFDKDGNYLKSLGRRGRGPNEFHDINFMGAAPENNILVLDRGNFRYTTITKEGEYVSDYVIKFENQFYLEDVAYLDDKLIGLYLYQGSAEERDYSDLYERNFFRILTPDLNEKTSEFGPFHDLNISDSFGWISSALYQGSFTLDRKKNYLLFPWDLYRRYL